MNPAFTNIDLKLFYKYLNLCTNYFEFGSGGSTYQAYKLDNIKKIYSVESSVDWIKQIISKLNCNSYQINEDDFISKKLNFFDINFGTKIGHLGLPLLNINDKVDFLIGVKNIGYINSINLNDDQISNGTIIKQEKKSPFNSLIEYTDNNIKKQIDVHPKLIRTNDEKIINNFNKYSDSIISLHENINPNLDLILIDGRFRVICALKSYQVINTNCIVLIDDFLNRKSYHILLDYFDIVEKGDRMVALKKKRNLNIPLELLNQYNNDVR